MPEDIQLPPDETKDPSLPVEEKGEDDPQEKLKVEIEKDLKTRADASRKFRKDKSDSWKKNVEDRLGTARSSAAGASITDTTPQQEINPNWALTKAKIATLFSRVPKVSGTHENKQFAPAIPPLVKSLNYELSEKRTKIGVAMGEELADVVNAAGIGGILVGYTARYGQSKPVPTADVSMLPPEAVQQGIASGAIPTETVPKVTSDRFFAKRISPTRLLLPADFTGSDFDDSDLIGHTGDCTWAEAKNEFKLTDEQKERVLSQEAGNDITEASLKRDNNSSKEDGAGNKRVYFDEVFYWRARFDPDEQQLKAIWRIVWVRGIEKPVIHEAWKGQKLVPETNTLIGATRFPIQILTLAYVSDNAVPPSDTEVSRPQVNDMRRSRSQMFQNRERSIPIRWYDVNRVDTTVQQSLMRGTWQGMIPTNGDGSRSIGEIARASYPSEDLAFDNQSKMDLLDLWQLDPSLGPQGGRQTKGQVQSNMAGFATRNAQERAAVAMHFMGLCEVLLGLMVLFSGFPILTDEERQQMEKTWDGKHILHDLVLKIRPNSTILPDPQERLQQVSSFLNLTAQSGYVNPMPIIVEMAELSDLDPTEVVVQPQPKQPGEPSMSFRFTGKQDLNNPAVMAMMVKHKQAPTPDEMKSAKAILKASQSLEDDETPATGAPQGAPGGQAGAPHPPGAPAHPAHPDWKLMPKIAKRSRDISSGS